MDTYRNKPVTITAEQFDGTEAHARQLADLINDTAYEKGWTQKATVVFDSEGLGTVDYIDIDAAFGDEGFLPLHKSDWLMFGTQGEYYPCKNSVFIEKYEAV